MVIFPLSLEQFRYVRKHRKNLEMRFHLKIILPEEYNHTCTLANVTGEKGNVQELKDLLREKVGENIDDPSTSNDIPLITLSDSDSEIQDPHETPIKKNKKKKKRKLDSFNCSTPLMAKKLATPVSSSEVKVLDDKTAPASKRARSGPAFPSEEYIPLFVTKNTDGARSVNIKCNNKSSINAANEEKSNSSCVESTSAASASSNTCETNVANTQDESVRIIEDTFFWHNKPLSASTTPCETDATFTLDNSVMIVGEDGSADPITDDSIRIIEDCFVLDKRPSLPKENDTTVLDDSILEITIPESWNQNRLKVIKQASQSNGVSQLTHLLTNRSTNRNSTTANNFPSLASIFSDRNNFIPLNSETLCSHPFPQLLVPSHNQINNGLQNVASGSNLLMPNGLVPQVPRPTTLKLRPVVIDGSNVARAHGLQTNTYSCKGIKISVDYFLKRGHTEITVFIPKFRKHQFGGKCPTTDAKFLEELEKAGQIAYSPSRRIDGKNQCCYDDRFVVQLATENGGVIVSNDNFRDIMVESKDFEKTIKERLLMFCFVGDTIMIPDDPLGRDGPRLKEFLTFPPE